MGLLLLASCAEPEEKKKAPPVPSGPGVMFTWPRDGQLDVPTRAPLVFRFSDPIDASAANAGCAGFCVEGPAGVVAGEVTVVGGNTIVFRVQGAWAEGTNYRVRVRSAVLPSATNLTDEPLVNFTTRRTRPVPGAAKVIGFNDTALDADKLPFLDVSTLRVLFSEPIDASSASAKTVKLVAADGSAVPANVSAGGAHVVLDPVSSLVAGASYTLSIDGVRDLSGEAATPFTRTLTPLRGQPTGPVLKQSLALAPGWSGAIVPSTLTGWPVNASQTSSPLIGAATLGLLAGGLQAELGDATAFGGPIPMILRRGQRLDLSPLGIRFGGVLESSYQTSTLHFTVLNDAVGFLTRNPYRPAAQLPDERSPVFVDVTMDTVLTAEDAAGNALATQTLMGLRLLGLSTVDDDQLAVEQVAALDLGTLGINVAPTTIALRLRTGGSDTTLSQSIPLPKLTATQPTARSTPAPPDAPLELLYSGAVTADSATITLTENGVAVPVRTRVEGSSLIIKPSRRLVDGAAMKLTFSGVTDATGQVITPSSTDALGGKNELSFTVAATPGTVNPPILASVTVGAPCAITGSSPSAGGACVGGEPSDTSYWPFEQPVNREIAVTFSAPMRTSTFAVGTTCGVGAVRVERLSSGGACQGVVSGSLIPGDRGFRFVPAEPLVAGARYRLVLVGGGNATCDSGELCSRGGLPLNTDPHSSLTSPGGPDVVLNFLATPASPDSLQPLLSQPLTDLNGNGEVDPGETVYEDNRAAMEVVDTTGIISSAKLVGADCLPTRDGQQTCAAMRTDLPVSVGEMKDRCPIDGNGQATATGGPCLEIHVLPNLILATSLTMDTKAVGVVPINGLSTHGLVLRMREVGGVAHGYIMRGPSDAYAQFVIHQSIYLDAPDLEILGGVVSHDLKSKVLDVVLKGPVTFFPDGRMKVALKNNADIPLTVNIRSLGLSGSIALRIPQGEMHLTLVGPPLR